MVMFAVYIVAFVVVMFFVLFAITAVAQAVGLVLHIVVYILTLGHVNLKKWFDEQMALQAAEKTFRKQHLVDQVANRHEAEVAAKVAKAHTDRTRYITGGVVLLFAISISSGAYGQHGSPVAAIRYEYMINLDAMPAHTGHWLPDNGVWSSRPIAGDKGLIIPSHPPPPGMLHPDVRMPALCGRPGICIEVTYRVAAYGFPDFAITCVWDVIQSDRFGIDVLEKNAEATFYFSHVRNLK